jgi:hypothetical protein
MITIITEIEGIIKKGTIIQIFTINTNDPINRSKTSIETNKTPVSRLFI